MNEDLFKENSSISELKLRLGWGITGQQDIGRDALTLYLDNYVRGNPSSQYQFGNTIIPIGIPVFRNEDLKWEETTTYNAGIDFGILEDRYTASIDFFRKESADLLANVTKKCKELVVYCGKKFPDDDKVHRLVQKFNPTKITETLPTSEYTAYSENKGEKLAFCLNKKKNETELIDMNTLIFVAIHELSHIMTKTEGHKQEFWQNFKFLLEQSKEAGIYNPIDYKKTPQPYCGMDITDNPFYDFK